MKIIYCRICWMNLYRGLYNDTMVNGGSYRDKHEIYNFMPHHGKYYGYVEPPGSGKSININNLDSVLPKNSGFIEDVLVVWLATEPEEGGIRIVGWYKDATIFRDAQQVPESDMALREEKNRTLYYIISDNAFLLLPNQRTFVVEGPGRSPVWYGDDETDLEVLNYINSFDDLSNDDMSDELDTGRPYVESHHLIPIEFHEDFKYSLDVEENIVCLCSNCHNEIHYGINNGALVRKLYSMRKELLHQAGLDVDENDLVFKAYRANE